MVKVAGRLGIVFKKKVSQFSIFALGGLGFIVGISSSQEYGRRLFIHVRLRETTEKLIKLSIMYGINIIKIKYADVIFHWGYYNAVAWN